MKRAPRNSVPPRDPKELVRVGWNALSYRYRPRGSHGDVFGHALSDYRSWLAPILAAVPPGSEVLDLGSGTGEPAARLLSARFRVTGVDISDRQVRRARRNVPRATFLRADITRAAFPTGRFYAVVALYSLIHVPRTEQHALFRRMSDWLVPGGWLLVIVGERPCQGVESGWLGSTATMYWSHFGAETYRRWLRSGGFRIVRDRFVPEGDGGHRLLLARKRLRRRNPPV